MSRTYRDRKLPENVPHADAPPAALPESAQAQKSKARAGRIMYIENKSGDGLSGDARIGRVTFSKTGKTLYYRDHRFATLNGTGFKANYFDVDTGDQYWISGPKRNGNDRLYGGTATEIDEDVREEYWRDIRRMPGKVASAKAKVRPKYQT
jgi:hypothetical protein